VLSTILSSAHPLPRPDPVNNSKREPIAASKQARSHMIRVQCNGGILLEKGGTDRQMNKGRDLPYRPGVGVMLLNAEGKVFVGQRLDSTLEAWEMPQGGVDKGGDGGQRQFWYLARFLGEDADVVIATDHAEFRAWKWADPEDLPALIVPF